MTDPRYMKRTIVKETVPSRRLPEGERPVRVYLPPGYEERSDHPAVYCQDGEDFFNFGRIATIANQLILDEGVQPFIIVGVDVDKAKRTAEYAPDGERFEAYGAFFAEELVPFMEEKYPVRRCPADRILAGDSLGATVSLHLALRYPQLFRRLLSFSGAFYPASLKLAEQADDLDSLEAFMIVGLQETAYETDHGVFDFVELNRGMKAILESKGARIEYGEHDGRHIWGFWQRHIPAALRTFLA